MAETTSDLKMQRDPWNAFISLQTFKSSVKGIFSGLSFAIKDIIDVEGIRTTAGSFILEKNVARSNATIVSRILDLGGTIVGKANTDEFAMDVTNLTSYYGPCLNPFDKKKICGGSSGGSAAAVSTGLADVGIGTDTGGSTRIPGSLCGVFGFKPTTGSIPTSGVIPFSRTLDTIGILSRDISTTRTAFKGLVEGPPSTDKRRIELKNLRVGFFSSSDSKQSKFFRDEVSDVFPNTIELDFDGFLERGFKIRRTIVAKEGADYHTSNFSDKMDLYHPQVRKFIEIGRKITEEEYVDAIEKSGEIKSDYEEVFKEVDIILCPTTEISAPSIDEVKHSPDYYRELLVRNTGFFNVVKAPSISIPVHFDGNLPIGLMVSSIENKDLDLLNYAEKIYNKIRVKRS